MVKACERRRGKSIAARRLPSFQLVKLVADKMEDGIPIIPLARMLTEEEETLRATLKENKESKTDAGFHLRRGMLQEAV